MPAMNLKTLTRKLNKNCLQALEAAVGMSLTRSHYQVDIEHMLLQVLNIFERSDRYDTGNLKINIKKLHSDCLRVLDGFKVGNTKSPSLSPDLVLWLEQTWVIASLEFNCVEINEFTLLLALNDNKHLNLSAKNISDEFLQLSREHLIILLRGCTNEQEQLESIDGNSSGIFPSRAKNTIDNNALEQFTIDLTAQAKSHKLDPVIGRDPEIRLMIDVLMRKRQNNPILVGEAGVGKTAVVEGLAQRIACGDIPDRLANVQLRILDLTLLQAGAGVKGEFENRLKSVIEAVKISIQPVILFIDEAHNLIGTGGEAGQGDAANLLKPALARGELRTIAATTWNEYNQYFEKDSALSRRFQVIQVQEPSQETAVKMMRCVAPHLQEHHQVIILDEAIIASVILSTRYLTSRRLPDKSISLLDTACAKVAMAQTVKPASIENTERELQAVENEIIILQRETVTGASHDERIRQLIEEKEKYAIELHRLNEGWQQELKLTRRIMQISHKLYELLQTTHETDDLRKINERKTNELQDNLERYKDRLGQLQDEKPLVHVFVDQQIIAQVIAEWTGIPTGKMLNDEIAATLSLQARLAESVVGQDHALHEITKRLQISKANLADARKPIAVFLLAGSSGTGKTETALSLARILYGSDDHLTIINMSEFKEVHKVSLLVGSPPGYVGYGKGGVLTEAVRRRPYSIILLDEIEKAHESVQEIFYQVFDKGMVMDGEGRTIDFKNTIIIMTSNVGTASLMTTYTADTQSLKTIEQMTEVIKSELYQAFKPAFLGRTTIIPYLPLSEDVLSRITKLQLQQIKNRIEQNYAAEFAYQEGVAKHIVQQCFEMESGARRIEHIINSSLLPQLSAEFLTRLANADPIDAVTVKVDKKHGFICEFS